MKKRDLKSLKLNKKSISNLFSKDLESIKGGTVGYTYYCSESAEIHRCEPCNN